MNQNGCTWPASEHQEKDGKRGTGFPRASPTHAISWLDPKGFRVARSVLDERCRALHGKSRDTSFNLCRARERRGRHTPQCRGPPRGEGKRRKNCTFRRPRGGIAATPRVQSCIFAPVLQGHESPASQLSDPPPGRRAEGSLRGRAGLGCRQGPGGEGALAPHERPYPHRTPVRPDPDSRSEAARLEHPTGGGGPPPAGAAGEKSRLRHKTIGYEHRKKAMPPCWLRS